MALKRLISAVKERLASNARLPKVTMLLRGSPMIMRHQNLSKCPGDVLFGTVMLSTLMASKMVPITLLIQSSAPIGSMLALLRTPLM